MKRRAVRWSNEAADDFDRAVAFLRERNQAAAIKMLDDIQAIAEALGRRNTGRPGRVNGTFERSVPRWRYIIAFEIRAVGDGEEIYILHVIHTARDWPKGLWPKAE
ncbi:MAG TPA: type II toxin-antitoxin system RelE/ParE family toxin [Caulobacterales bacterium]|nr:type II toxin-antitoxin system RelE/ParE family toxin [Caulobacterales bacterium]